MDATLMNALEKVAQKVSFAAGDALRTKGVFASDFLLITEGVVDCMLSDDQDVPLKVDPGDVVGEFGFLTGQPANATLRANARVTALSLNGTALAQLQRDTPAIAAKVLRHLASLMGERSEKNVGLLEGMGKEDRSVFQVLRCSTLDQLRIARKIRFDVCCVEFGRVSPYADHADGTMTDTFDQTGTSFLAYHEGRPVGTVRVNLGHDTDLSALIDVYGVANTHHPIETSAVVTASAIHAPYRTKGAYLSLIEAVSGFVHGSGAAAVFIDCLPELERVHAEIGFTRTAPDFVHPENGLSVPMVFDLSENGIRAPFEDGIRGDRHCD